MLPKLGILAGGGELPRLLISACREAGREVFVIAFEGQCDPQTAQGVAHAWVPLGKAGRAIELLKANGARDLIMAGRIRKPSFTQLMPDARALKVLARGVFAHGDDSLLRTIVEMLEREEGFRLVGAHEVMPELLTPSGQLGAHAPRDAEWPVIRAAMHAALDLGARDVGQAAVAGADGRVLALEDRSGTDAMLEVLAGNPDARGAVLAKMCKPGQEKRADLPAIGAATVANAARAGLKGIVLEAGASLIINRAQVVAAADAAGLFLIGVTP